MQRQAQHVGERDDVRIRNSGQTASRAVPGLRVGQTLPLTAGRKPEARPPISAGCCGESGAVAFKPRAAGLSEPKNAQGFGDGVPMSVERRALDLSEEDVSKLIEVFQLLDRWDREGSHGTTTM